VQQGLWNVTSSHKRLLSKVNKLSVCCMTRTLKVSCEGTQMEFGCTHPEGDALLS